MASVREKCYSSFDGGTEGERKAGREGRRERERRRGREGGREE